MIRSILVPLDGSSFSEQALPLAMKVARASGARLHLVQVHEPPVLPVNPEGASMAFAEWESAIRQAEEENLRAVANRCMEAGVAVARAELLEAPVANALSTYAHEVGVDLVVMTTHGRGGISRAWVGSVADAVARRCSAPVLLIRPPLERTGADLGHILIPLDGSELSEQVIEAAVALGVLTGARYTLLRVALPVPSLPIRVELPADEQRALEERQRAEILQELDRAAEPLRVRGYRVDTMVVHDESPALAILECAGQVGADLIALATRGRGGWSRIALGSVADKVMRGAVVPVLLYRPMPRSAEGGERAQRTREHAAR